MTIDELEFGMFAIILYEGKEHIVYKAKIYTNETPEGRRGIPTLISLRNYKYQWNVGANFHIIRVLSYKDILSITDKSPTQMLSILDDK